MSEKLSLADVLAAIDMGARTLWNDLSDSHKKDVGFFVLNRFASAVTSTKRDVKELAVLKTNEYYNKHFFTIAKHQELLWYLLCMCEVGDKKIQRHPWIGSKKKEVNGDKNIVKFLQEKYPNIGHDELEILSSTTSKDDARAMAREMGMTDKEIKKILP